VSLAFSLGIDPKASFGLAFSLGIDPKASFGLAFSLGIDPKASFEVLMLFPGTNTHDLKNGKAVLT
jgi:hypothetical protein